MSFPYVPSPKETSYAPEKIGSIKNISDAELKTEILSALLNSTDPTKTFKFVISACSGITTLPLKKVVLFVMLPDEF